MPATTHSRLGASVAKRWIECPGSVAACKGKENQQTVYAAEGSAAHALGELCLRKQHLPDRYLGEWISTTGERFASEAQVPEKRRNIDVFPIDEDMVEAVETYVTFFFDTYEDGDEYEIEQRVDLSSYHPDLFGTADLVIYKPASKRLIVADYKHGRGVAVEAKDNVQGLYYAAGAAVRHHNRGIDGVEVVIIQPRCVHKDGPVRRWETSAAELLEWVSDLADAAKRTEAKDAPRKAGDWCKFCPAAATCAAYRDAACTAAAADFASAEDITTGEVILGDPDRYSGEALGRVLANAHLIEDWCSAIKKHAHAEALAGRVPDGWKLVNTRATRKWRDSAAAEAELMEFDESLWRTQPELKSVAQVEKALGKKVFGKLEAELVEKKSSGVVLALASDKREAVRPDAAKEFA